MLFYRRSAILKQEIEYLKSEGPVLATLDFSFPPKTKNSSPFRYTHCSQNHPTTYNRLATAQCITTNNNLDVPSTQQQIKHQQMDAWVEASLPWDSHANIRAFYFVLLNACFDASRPQRSQELLLTFKQLAYSSAFIKEAMFNYSLKTGQEPLPHFSMLCKKNYLRKLLAQFLQMASFRFKQQSHHCNSPSSTQEQFGPTKSSLLVLLENYSPLVDTLLILLLRELIFRSNPTYSQNLDLQTPVRTSSLAEFFSKVLRLSVETKPVYRDVITYVIENIYWIKEDPTNKTITILRNFCETMSVVQSYNEEDAIVESESFVEPNYKGDCPQTSIVLQNRNASRNHCQNFLEVYNPRSAISEQSSSNMSESLLLEKHVFIKNSSENLQSNLLTTDPSFQKTAKTKQPHRRNTSGNLKQVKELQQIRRISTPTAALQYDCGFDVDYQSLYKQNSSKKVLFDLDDKSLATLEEISFEATPRSKAPMEFSSQHKPVSPSKFPVQPLLTENLKSEIILVQSTILGDNLRFKTPEPAENKFVSLRAAVYGLGKQIQKPLQMSTSPQFAAGAFSISREASGLLHSESIIPSPKKSFNPKASMFIQYENPRNYHQMNLKSRARNDDSISRNSSTVAYTQQCSQEKQRKVSLSKERLPRKLNPLRNLNTSKERENTSSLFTSTRSGSATGSTRVSRSPNTRGAVQTVHFTYTSPPAQTRTLVPSNLPRTMLGRRAVV